MSLRERVRFSVEAWRPVVKKLHMEFAEIAKHTEGYRHASEPIAAKAISELHDILRRLDKELALADEDDTDAVCPHCGKLHELHF